ncbi:choline dehydrogenase [Erythrobacter litoralis]|nr:choline dehydrogenase [Erythrobacter litoralis]
MYEQGRLSLVADFDYVIVGGGSAGCVLANRLTEDGRNRVLLLEAGGSDASLLVRVPAAIVKLIGNPRYDWGFSVEPDPTRKGRSDYWPAGRVLGGSSSINGMLYVRGARGDFDQWAAAGNAGWAFADIEHCFRKLEACAFTAGKERGRDGPQVIDSLRTVHPLAATFTAAARAAGLPDNPDYNGESQEGIGPPQLTQKRGRRWSAADGYLRPAKSRANLTVLTRAQATGIVFEGRRAVGVRYVRKGREEVARAGREVVLSAGALQSPKLLMLSGIGPAEHLAEHGIAPLIDQGHVGANLMEHPSSQLSFAVDTRTFNQEINSARVAFHGLNWLVRRRGPATSPYPHAVGFFRSGEGVNRPDIQLMFGPFGFELTSQGVTPSKKPTVTIVIGLSYARSSGRLSLRSGDWREPPRIALDMLSDPRDVADLTAASRFARDIMRQGAIAPHVRGEIAPGSEVRSDDEWEDYLRRTTDPTYHPVATCRMAPGADEGVVDPRLRVHGAMGLRVVDASVFPAHVSGNTNGAVMMVAERAAEFILADRG